MTTPRPRRRSPSLRRLRLFPHRPTRALLLSARAGARLHRARRKAAAVLKAGGIASVFQRMARRMLVQGGRSSGEGAHNILRERMEQRKNGTALRPFRIGGALCMREYLRMRLPFLI